MLSVPSGRNTSKVLKQYIWDARCIKYKQWVQLRWRDDNQTTFFWHVMVNSKKLSATVTTDHTTHPLARTSESLVFDTAIFTPPNGHLYLIQQPSSGSAQGADILKVHGYPLILIFRIQSQVSFKDKFIPSFKIYPRTHFSNAPQDHQKFHCWTWSQSCLDKSLQCRRAFWNTCQGCLNGPEPSLRPRHRWKRKNGKDIKERGKEEDCWRNSLQGGDCHSLHWGVPCLQSNWHIEWRCDHSTSEDKRSVPVNPWTFLTNLAIIP